MKNLRIVGTFEEPLFIVKEVCDILGLANPTNTIRNIPEEWKQMGNIQTDIQSRSMNLITLNGLKQIAQSTRSNNICVLLKMLKDANINLDLTTKYVCKEASFIRVISKAFEHFPQKHQYRIGKYRIDLYFTDHKLAVECDENGHADRKNDKERQRYIEKQLGCTFIRFNPDEKYFNIGAVINRILIETYEN